MRPAWGCAGAAFALVAVTVVFVLLDREHMPTDVAIGDIGFIVPITAFAVVGALIASRRPENSVGWICLAIGVLFAVVAAADAVSSWGLDTGSLPSGLCHWIAWLTAAWVPALGLMGTQLPLRLPDGVPLWRRYANVCAGIVAVVTVVMFCQPTSPEDAGRGLENPTGMAWAEALAPLLLVMMLSFVGGIASVVVRYRRAASVERQQLRWVAFGAVVFVGVFMTAIGTLLVAGIDDSSVLGSVLTTLGLMAYAAIPVGIGFAVLRHRLYDIDVVINRALVYTGLTATLGAAYLATVLLFQVALKPLTEDSGLAVAASTLAVAGLFGPARARIQAAVDRRFFRRKYDATRTLEGFSARLRDEIDLDALSGELSAVVRSTMQPAHVSLWLRERPGRRVP